MPCASATQCTSGNCVDGVCCNTACGGGARDLQSCSNVYGVVPGLVNGACTALTVGDACGSLTTVNPCSWRGTVVNGGNNSLRLRIRVDWRCGGGPLYARRSWGIRSV